MILLVFSTVALLQENARTMAKFVRDNHLDYQIVKTVDGNFAPYEKTIFVFTPERTIQLLASYPDLHIDFFGAIMEQRGFCKKRDPDLSESHGDQRRRQNNACHQ